MTGRIDLHNIMRERLGAALRDRNLVAVSALRSALAAVGNAEAVPADETSAAGIGHSPIAGALPGLGAGDAPRRSLTDADVAGIIRTEITERQNAAAAYQRSGHAARSERLHREAQVLQAVLQHGPAQGA